MTDKPKCETCQAWSVSDTGKIDETNGECWLTPHAEHKGSSNFCMQHIPILKNKIRHTLAPHIQERLDRLEAIEEARKQIHWQKRNPHTLSLARFNRENIYNLLNLISNET